MGIFNADVIINIPLAFFSLQKSGLVRVYLTSVFLLLSVPRCFGDQKPQFDSCSCKECMFFNIGRKGFHPVSTIRACWPMDHVIYDFIGKLRVSERGYCFILIMVCVMTCFVFLKPLRTKSAKEVAFALVNVFANFGVPQILQSDNEQVMVADVLEELRKLGGFQLRRIMKYFPRQNGVVERFVQETKQVLLKWAKGDFSGWEYYIPAIQMGLNNRIISRHRSRPFSVMFGRRMNKFENFEGVSSEGERERVRGRGRE